MPPRFAYWTIIAGGLPTAFRSTEREELLATFNRLKEKHPDAEMKWFARGKLWNSPEEAREDRLARTEFRKPADGAQRRPFKPRRQPGERRGKDWRPGGEHRDPRQDFKDAKKARNVAHRQKRWARKNEPFKTQSPKPNAQSEGTWRRDRPKPWQKDRPEGQGERPKGKFGNRPKFGGPKKPWQNGRPPAPGPKPKSWARPEGQGERPKGKFGDRPKFAGPKPWEKDRPDSERPRLPRTDGRPPRPPRRKP